MISVRQPTAPFGTLAQPVSPLDMASLSARSDHANWIARDFEFYCVYNVMCQYFDCCFVYFVVYFIFSCQCVFFLGPISSLHKFLPIFRSPSLISLHQRFFLSSPTKLSVLRDLGCGLQGDWDVSQLPPCGSAARNYLKTDVATRKCRERFRNEILKGRMLGGPGWSAAHVRGFLGTDFWLTPCGSVEKDGDPDGRIVHNYSHQVDGTSLNEALIDNSVRYISFKSRVSLLSKVSWYIKVDLKNGYRQLAVHPAE